VMTPRVEEALGHLLCRAKAELWAEYRRGPYDPVTKPTILVRMCELHDHMCAVAARSKSPAELRTRLIRDGSIPDVPIIEWYSRDGRHYRDMSHLVRPQTRSGRERCEHSRPVGYTRAGTHLAPEKALDQHGNEYAFDHDAHHRLDGRHPSGRAPCPQLLERRPSVNSGETHKERIP
jgi:hypothetical protein